MHPKNIIQKSRLLNSPLWLCMERAKYYTEVYQDTEDEYPSIQAAKALKKSLENMTIKIYPEEILVGNRSSKHIAPPIAAERGDFTFIFKYLLPNLEKFGYRISHEHKKILFEKIIPYWTGKTVRDYKVKIFEQKGLASRLNLSFREIKRKIRAFGFKTIGNLVLEPNAKTIDKVNLLLKLPKIFKAIQGGAADNVKGRGRCIDTQAHIVLGHKNILRYGFKGIKGKAEDRLKSVKSDSERNFLEAVIMVCEAMRNFSNRFSVLAEKMAKKEESKERKDELLQISEICKKIPWNPPQSFYEALQSLWFTQNAAIISYGAGSGITPGRVDQLLYPYYEQDIENKSLAKEHALRLIEEFLIKINNNVVIWPNIAGVRLNPLGSDIENITIGGLDPNGEDATNDLSYLFIDAIKNTNLATSVSFRFSKKTPESYIKKVLELHKYTNSPAIFNDDIIVKAMMLDGYSLEAARDYCIVGCVEPSGNGDTFGATGGSKVYLPAILDLIFNRGKTSFFGAQDTRDTGNPEDFKSFDEFMNAFYLQLKQIVNAVAEATNLRDDIWATRFHNPLISCTIDGCIENARDMTQGGAKYKFQAIGAAGLGTVVDSLAAIKKFVYEDKKITMKGLMFGLRTNFKNNEQLRQFLKNGPKFGNDDDYVDRIAVELVNEFCNMVANKKLTRGGHFKASFISYGLNVYEGALEPATPNGRRAGEPFSNSISPSNGAEKNGPTATLNSLAKIDHKKIGYGDSLNMRFPRFLVSTENGLEIFKVLVESYFEKGGMHLQVNTMGTETLREAQICPEKYEDLIVRVSGYAAYFTRLGKEIQDDIIERVEFSTINI